MKRRQRFHLFCGAMLALWLATSGAAQATTYTVNSYQPTGGKNYKTLQELRSADISWASGDVIILGVGTDSTLTSAINFGDKSITITGSGTVAQHAANPTQFATLSGGKLTIQSMDSGPLVFEGFSGSDYGGAIYTSDGSTIIFSDGTNTFTGNIAGAAGGAIYTRDGGGVTFSGGKNTFTANTANGGGAIYIRDDNGVTISGGTNTFTGNESFYDGGAIYISPGGTGLTISGGINTFDNNSTSTTSWGGAILVHLDEITISGGTNTFNNNTASWGGAIFGWGSDIIVSGGTNNFTNNAATVDGHGGAIFGSGSLSFSGDSVNTFTGNTAEESGGAISSGDIIFSGNSVNTFTDNATGKHGGAIHSMYADVNATFSDNSINTFTNHSAGENGGTIYIAGIAFSGGINTFTNSTAGNSGGTIICDQITFSGGTNTFSNSTAGNSGGTIASGYYYDHDLHEVIFSGGDNSFDSSTARSGGSIYSTGDVIFSGGTNIFSNSIAKKNESNDIYSNDGTGGVIYGTDIIFSGGTNTFINNTAEKDGGVICSYAGEVTFSDGINTFTDNIAKGNGGALFLGSSSTISGGTNTFTGNKSNSGSAIFVSSIWISGGINKFIDNIAEENGTIYSDNHLEISGGDNTFSGNKAASGGVLYGDHNFPIYITGGTNTFTDNTANDGGAISSGTVTISGGSNTFTGNTANDGGAIFSHNYVDISGGVNTFLNNSANIQGGAVYMGESGSFIADAGDILFQGNTANGKANAIYMANGGGTLLLAAEEGHSVLLYDPIESASDWPYLSVYINSTNEGVTAGTVLFDTHKSSVYGNTTVYGGTMKLQHGAIYGANNTTGEYRLNSGATLAISGGGTISANNIILDSDSILAYDLANYNGGLVLDGSSYTITSDDRLNFAVQLDSWQNGTYTLVTTNADTFTGFDAEDALNRLIWNASNDRLSAAFSTDNTGQLLILQLGVTENVTVTWAGGSGVWSVGDENWGDNGFAPGDSVIFDGSNTPNLQEITVADNMQVGEMTILGGDYAFANRDISASGALNISEGGQVLLSNQTSFAGGVTMTGSSNLTIGADQSLTSNASVNVTNSILTVSQNATLTAADGVTIAKSHLKGTGTIAGSLSLSDSTLHAAPSNDNYLSVTGAVNASGANTINLTSWSLGTFVVLSSETSMAGSLANSAITYLGNDLGKRQAASLKVEGTMLEVILSSVNLSLEWTGQNAVWGAGDDGDWTGPNDTGQKFFDGDAVIFGSIGSKPQEIEIDTGGVQVASMKITGGSYAFKGGSITSIKASTLGDTADERLVISGNDTRAGFNNDNLSFAGGTLVTDGALISGNFTHTGNMTLSNRAIVSPGNSIGTITVDSITFDSTSFYDVEVDPTDTKKSDLLRVTGTATLAGTVRHIGLPEASGKYSPIGTWTILTAGDIAGSFDNVESVFAFLDPSLSYNDGDVLLTLTRNEIKIEEVVPNPSHNQRAVATGLISLEGTGSHLYNQIMALPAGTNFGALYNDLSGEIYATIPGVLQDYERNFGRSLRARLHQDVERMEGYPLWASLEGRSSTTDSTPNTAEADFSTWALNAGAETKLGENWLAGLALRFGDSSLDVDDRHSEADVYSFGIGAYAGTSVAAGEGKVNLTFGGSYGYHNIETERRIYGLGDPQKLEADYNAHSFQVFAEAGYGMAIGEQAMIEPYLGLSWNSIWTESFTESGGTARLQGDSQHTGNLASTLGLRWQMQASEKVALTADVRWQHLFGDEEPETELSFMGGRNFAIIGGPMNRDAAGLDLGLEIDLGPATELRASYEGYYGEDVTSHGGKLMLVHRF